jgi:hypothetical protein
MTQGANYWIWGSGATRSLQAGAEAERVNGLPAGSWVNWIQQYRADTGRDDLPIADLAPGAVERTHRLRATAPESMLAFGARDLWHMATGLLARTQERNQKAKVVVFEDHGLWGHQPGANGSNEVILFFGRDGVTVSNFGQHRHKFQHMGKALAPGAKVYLLHCYAFADGGQLARMISIALGAPVIGMDAVQDVGNQAFEGNAFQAYQGRVTSVSSLPQSVLHFD